MDENLQVLLIALLVAALVGALGAIMMSTRVRRFGLIGALRRAFSNERSQYRH